MVTTASPYTDDRYHATAGLDYHGVVRISNNGFYRTGTLLYDGQVILAAVHLFTSAL